MKYLMPMIYRTRKIGPKRWLQIVEGKFHDKKPKYTRKGRKRYNWKLCEDL